MGWRVTRGIIWVWTGLWSYGYLYDIGPGQIVVYRLIVKLIQMYNVFDVELGSANATPIMNEGFFLFLNLLNSRSISLKGIQQIIHS